ncbi:MAG: GNAT family N-acetyltransferase [Byssovorax sp.]
METPSAPLTLRPEGPGDEAFCLALFASTRAAEIACLGGAPGVAEAFVRMQHAAQQRGHRAQHPDAERAIVLRAGEPIGSIVIDRGSEAFVLVDVTLVPGERGRGTGARLLGALLDEARAAGREVRLHVVRENPARRLYARLGFVSSGGDDLYEAMTWSPPGAG